MKRIIFVIIYILLLCGCEKEKTDSAGFLKNNEELSYYDIAIKENGGITDVENSILNKPDDSSAEEVSVIESRLSPYDTGDNIDELDDKIRVLMDQAIKNDAKMAGLTPGAYDREFNLLFRWNELVKAKYVSLTGYRDGFELLNIEKIDEAEIIIIDKSVYRISERAFEKHNELLYVYIPDSVQSIGSSAFSDCTRLKSIVLHGEVFLSESAFYKCENLELLCGSCQYIPNNCFALCQNIKVVQLQAQYIGNFAFQSCINLVKVDLSKTIEIGTGAFYDCFSLYEIVIPAGTKKIEEEAFSGCGNIRSINVDPNNEYYYSENNSLVEKTTKKLIAGCMNSIIPKDVEVIARGAFRYCEKLKKATFHDGLREIGYQAFNGCSELSEIYIPASVDKIGERAFSFCNNICRIKVDENNPYFDSRNDCNAIFHSDFLILGCYTTLIPENIIGISDAAFEGVTKLESITIPMSLTKNPLYISDDAFLYCSSLKEVTIFVLEGEQEYIIVGKATVSGSVNDPFRYVDNVIINEIKRDYDDLFFSWSDKTQAGEAIRFYENNTYDNWCVNKLFGYERDSEMTNKMNDWYIYNLVTGNPSINEIKESFREEAEKYLTDELIDQILPSMDYCFMEIDGKTYYLSGNAGSPEVVGLDYLINNNKYMVTYNYWEEMDIPEMEAEFIRKNKSLLLNSIKPYATQ